MEEDEVSIKEVRRELQEKIEDLKKVLEKAEHLFTQESNSVLDEKRKWEVEKVKMATKASALMPGGKVKLDVGGHHFSTTLETLQKVPNTMLAIMFSGRFPLTPDAEGRVFIDRDGTYFRDILNYLRDGTLAVPDDEKYRQELLRESEFYSIDGLVQLLLSVEEDIKYSNVLQALAANDNKTASSGTLKINPPSSVYTLLGSNLPSSTYLPTLTAGIYPHSMWRGHSTTPSTSSSTSSTSTSTHPTTTVSSKTEKKTVKHNKNNTHKYQQPMQVPLTPFSSKQPPNPMRNRARPTHPTIDVAQSPPPLQSKAPPRSTSTPQPKPPPQTMTTQPQTVFRPIAEEVLDALKNNSVSVMQLPVFIDELLTKRLESNPPNAHPNTRSPT